MQYPTHIMKYAAIVVFATALAACEVFSGHQTSGEYVDDVTITNTIRAEILQEPNLKIMQINVETMKGVVQLSGFVDSQQNKNKAVGIARQVRGVTSVKDDLMVK